MKKSIINQVDYEKEVLRIVKERNPDFFNDKEMEEIFFIVIREMKDELQKLSPLDTFAVVCKTTSLMYSMASAAMKSISVGKLDTATGKFVGQENRSMNQIFIEKMKKD